jgi:hypothetical protein
VIPATFLDALADRHFANLTRQEFTRAVRALSARYVERRGQLRDRSPLDSAGKRAAFGLFYASLHWLVVEAVVSSTMAPDRGPSVICDLGCGTGVCGAAWALSQSAPPPVEGIDMNGWALAEARWNLRALGVTGRVVRDDVVDGLARALRTRRPAGDLGIIAGWAVNELPDGTRDRLLSLIEQALTDGASLLVIEPLARGVAPWWDHWAATLAPLGVVGADCRFSLALPPLIADLAKSAGLSAPSGARVLSAQGRRTLMA